MIRVALAAVNGTSIKQITREFDLARNTVCRVLRLGETASSAAAQAGHSIVGCLYPVSFPPGEAYQFDWSTEVVVLHGTTTIVQVAQVRLCHSRMPSCVPAIPRQAQEMVFDVHDKALSFYKEPVNTASMIRCARRWTHC